METGKFFFSYARDDSEFVLKLAEDLRSTGTNLWLDQLDIPGGARWDDAVEEALHASPCLLVVLSPASVASDNVKDEISFGLENRKTIVPILFKDCAIPFRLKRFQYIDFTAGYDEGFARLVQALKLNQLSTRQRSEEEAKRKPDEERTRAVREATAPERMSENTLKPGTIFRDKFKDLTQGPEMVVIPAGMFKMGDIENGGDGSERPVHTVRISRPFAIGKYEVTFEEYLRFYRVFGSLMPLNDDIWTHWLAGRWFIKSHPVSGVSWKGAVAYAEWLSQQTAKRYRLPSEAEWEYAARGGRESAYWWGNEMKFDMAHFANIANMTT
jgi:hypothetical protein